MFYVYRIYGEMGETVYIGKGVGRRLEQQKRRFQSEGEVVHRFNTEAAAYLHEKLLIEIENPPLNQIPGGTGGKVGSHEQKVDPFKLLMRMIAGMLRANHEGYKFWGIGISKKEVADLLRDSFSQLGYERVVAGLRDYGINLLSKQGSSTL